MKNTSLGVLAGLLGFLLLAELLFRVLPVSSATKADYYIDPRILTYAPNDASRYSTDWDLRHPQSLKTNGYGFVSEHEFKRNDRAIALIGDSFVVAGSLAAADRPASQLEGALGGNRPVYAMGSAGTALLDYAERIRFAHEQFGVRDFVVLMERGDVAQALCGSGNVDSQCLDPKTLAPRTESAAPASPLKRALRESALAQYLVSQLKIVPADLVKQVLTRSVPVEPADPAVGPKANASALAPAELAKVDAVTAAFFARVKPHVTGRLIIVVDANRQALMNHSAEHDPKRQRFIELAREAGATVIDTETLFTAHFAQSTLSLDLSPSDGHFNPLSVRLVAVAIAKAFSESTPLEGYEMSTALPRPFSIYLDLVRFVPA